MFGLWSFDDANNIAIVSICIFSINSSSLFFSSVCPVGVVCRHKKHAPTQTVALQLVQVYRCDSMASINRPFFIDLRYSILFVQPFFFRRTAAFSTFFILDSLLFQNMDENPSKWISSIIFSCFIDFSDSNLLPSNEMKIDISLCLAFSIGRTHNFLFPKSTFSFCHLSS